MKICDVAATYVIGPEMNRVALESALSSILDGMVDQHGKVAEHAICDAASRVLERKARSDEEGGQFKTSDEAKKFMRVRLATKDQEVFTVAFLNNQHRLIAAEDMFRGTIDSAQVYPRVIAARALQLNAAALIVAHNHPSGEAEPSRADINITARIRMALDLLDIRLLDHLIVTAGEVVSLSQRGEL